MACTIMRPPPQKKMVNTSEHQFHNVLKHAVAPNIWDKRVATYLVPISHFLCHNVRCLEIKLVKSWFSYVYTRIGFRSAASEGWRSKIQRSNGFLCTGFTVCYYGTAGEQGGRGSGTLFTSYADKGGVKAQVAESNRTQPNLAQPGSISHNRT